MFQAIHTKKDYEKALARIDRLLDFPEGSPEERELEVWSILVEAYESEVDEKIPDATPIQVLEFVMEQKGLTRVDLEPFIGPRGRVSEVMTGKRPLSLSMIRALSTGLQIPADALLGKDEPIAVTQKRTPVRGGLSVMKKKAAKTSRHSTKEMSFGAIGGRAKRTSSRISAKRK